ncbi:MAG: hypothetical protein P8163_04420 [Candidatus Thiodiazotropha sp.]
MNRFFYISAGMLTVVGLCTATFVLGKFQAIEFTSLNIDNTINGVIAELPEANREGMAELLHPVAQLIASKLKSGTVDQRNIEKTADSLQKTIQQLSLQSYRSDTSPFVPPLNKAQLICGEAFTLVYLGQDQFQHLLTKLKINSNIAYLSPGDINQYKTAEKELEISYLEYKKDLKGPFLKYECRNRSQQLSGVGSVF